MRRVGCSRLKKYEVTIKKQFVLVAKSYAHFRNFGVHSNSTAKSAIEKLQRIAKEKKA